MNDSQRAANRRSAWILLLVAAGFFVAVVLRRTFLG